jgi:predicted DNA-binding protein (UPF0251 family)
VAPRSRKPRRCRCSFKGTGFRPVGIPLAGAARIAFSREELETLKLCDGDGLTQAAAGRCMDVSRGTVQRILARARAKVATALACGQVLVFERGRDRSAPARASNQGPPPAERQKRRSPCSDASQP